MRHLARFAMLATLAAVAGCSDISSPDPALSHTSSRSADVAKAGRIRVYTQNLYVGANVDAVIDSLATGDLNATFQALAQAVATLQRTSFATRAAAIADEIARTRPDVIGFQEGSKIDVDLTPLGVPLEAHEDFLATLNGALAARGLSNYTVTDTIALTQVSLLSGLVSLIDFDMMLVNSDRVTVNSHFKKVFTHNDGLFAGINFIRGFLEAKVTVEGLDYDVIATHTEGTDLTDFGVDYHQLHVQQVQELVDRADLSGLPAIIMGDLNDFDTSPMYQVMIDAGFADLWRTLHPGAKGATCCHLDDLSDPNPNFGRFQERIDFIFVRDIGNLGRDAHGQITRYGLLTSDRLTGPDGTIWPSDHAGLVATLLTPASMRR